MGGLYAEWNESSMLRWDGGGMPRGRSRCLTMRQCAVRCDDVDQDGGGGMPREIGAVCCEEGNEVRGRYSTA
jgi:hypothetical protein